MNPAITIMSSEFRFPSGWAWWAIPVTALAGYWSTLDNSFGLDDFPFVARLIAGESLSNIWADQVFIRPVGHFLSYIDFWIWGTWAPGYHLTNLLLHILNGWLLVAVVRHLWPSVAGVAGCLFAIAPFTVEGVAWISARFDVLMTSWYLLGILALLRDRSWLGAAAFGLALLSKEPAITAPAVAVGVALWRRTTLAERTMLASPTIAISLLYIGFRLWWLGGIGGYGVVRGNPVLGLDLGWVPVNAWNLVQLLGSPISHKVSGVVPVTWWFGPLWLIPWLGLLRLRAWRPPLAVGLGTFLLTYLPTVFVPISTHGVTWRFLYLPSAGLALAAAWTGSQLPWRKVAFVATLSAWILVLHANLIFWESSSWHIKQVGEELQRREPRRGQLWIVVPASFAGAYMATYSAAGMGAIYRPGVTVIGLTEREASRLPPEFLPSVVAPRPMLCFPTLGKSYCPRPLPTYWQHPT